MITDEKIEEAINTIEIESKEALENLKNKAILERNKTLGIIIVCIILSLIFLAKFRLVLIPIAIFTFLMIYVIKAMFSKNSIFVSYKKEYKLKVIQKLLEFFNDNFTYIPERGMSSISYKNAGFQLYDRYHAEDLIKGKIEEKYDIALSEVLVQAENKDENGNTTYVTKFKGLFTEIENDVNIASNIFIRRDKKFSFSNKLNGLKNVSLDSLEFEKDFDVYSDNELITVQILTSEVMMLLSQMYKKMNFEISIINQKIYMRFPVNQNLFEANYKKEIINRKEIYRYCEILNFVIELFLKINSAMKNANL